MDNIPTAGPLVVDAANVVGSVPDGWWRDRAGAAARLRDRLAAAVAAATIPAAVEVVLVVEGAARGVEPVDGVRVVSAPRGGDDTIVAVVREHVRDHDGPVTVVTADRALRERVAAAGAAVIGPGTLRRWVDHEPGRG
jgi:hypothetical protein